MQNTVGVELDRDEAIDIDTPEDFRMAENYINLSKSNKLFTNYFYNLAKKNFFLLIEVLREAV